MHPIDEDYLNEIRRQARRELLAYVVVYVLAMGGMVGISWAILRWGI